MALFVKNSKFSASDLQLLQAIVILLLSQCGSHIVDVLFDIVQYFRDTQNYSILSWKIFNFVQNWEKVYLLWKSRISCVVWKFMFAYCFRIKNFENLMSNNIFVLVIYHILASVINYLTIWNGCVSKISY